ncbi:MAG TPA: DUF3857 domain-containing protein [Candidatus Angelobacter sp.]|nr:DUF3857 domain-containing protein [Candidatus Angelobacter sp.]
MSLSNCVRKAWLAALLLFPLLCAGQGRPWLPVDPKDLQMKELQQIPGAQASLLYYADEIDDTSHNEFLYSRIKIFSDGGKQYANVEIPLLEKFSVENLAARIIHADGKIVETAVHPFEKVVLKGKGLRVRVQAFTLADVTAGDIIEYQYQLHQGDKGLYHHHWEVQHDLFAVKEHFLFKYNKQYSVRWLPSAGLQQSPQHDLKANTLEMDSENVPPFEAEEQMPPVAAYKWEVKFFYTSPFMSSPSSYWYEIGRGVSRWLDQYVGNAKEIASEAAAVVGTETDPEKKLRKLYARAQEIRNLSYERHRTEKERKNEELKENKNAVNVLHHGYGDRHEITRLFVALARGAGFTASVVFVSSRESRLFDREVLSFSQLDSEIARVRLNGKDIFLDPGTRFCPYGLMRWMRTGTAAMDMADPGQFISTPGAPEDSAIIERSAELKLDTEGAVKGEVRIEFEGLEALERRLSALDTDDAGRKKELEDEVKLWLPANAKVEMEDVVGWEKEYEPLTAVFKVEVPEFASAAGKRLMVPTALFQPKQKRVLKSGTRRFPVYYNYAFSENDHMNLQLPEGYGLETLASPQTAATKFARYTTNAAATGPYVNLDRSLRFNGVFFQPDRYEELRLFFAKVQAGDELQTVVRQSPAESKAH